jgi:hypothetical protein
MLLKKLFIFLAVLNFSLQPQVYYTHYHKIKCTFTSPFNTVLTDIYEVFVQRLFAVLQ